MILLLIFLIVNFLFYNLIWQQIIFPDPQWILTVQGESHIYELVAEKVRESIITGVNPFAPIMSVLYPLGWNFAPDDVAPINGLYYLFLRPFFSIHQSLMLITVLSVLVSNISMYILLRRLGHEKNVSFIISLIFGFTPFVSYRIWGHPTYVALYLFVLPAICFVSIIKEKVPRRKALWSMGLALSLALCPLTNLYFTVMMGLMIGLLVLFSVILDRKNFFRVLRSNIRYLVASVIGAALLLSPWLVKVADSYLVNGYPEVNPVLSVTPLSSDILSIFWPLFNPYYVQILERGSKVLNFRPWFETLIYPGGIFLVCMLLYIKYRRKLSRQLSILYIAAFTMYVLTLGPVLKIAGKVTEVPLPYMALYEIPFMQMARAPGRFIVPVIFLGSIISAYVLTAILSKFTNLKKLTIVAVLFVFFLFDHSVVPSKSQHILLPTKIYEYLAGHPEGPLLEVPFVVRDGLKNFGNANSVWTSRTHTRHRHPVFSIYAGRVPDDMFEYYKKNPLFSVFGYLVDENSDARKKALKDPDLKNMTKVLNFYKIRYVSLLDNQDFSQHAQELLAQLGFVKILKDSDYSLWERTPQDLKLTQYDFTQEDPNIILGYGWGAKEKVGRWAERSIVRLFLHSTKKSSRISFSAASLVDDQPVRVYINQSYVGKVRLTDTLENYTLAFPSHLNKDINTIRFLFLHMYSPSQIIPGSQDMRQLGALFSTVKIH